MDQSTTSFISNDNLIKEKVNERDKKRNMLNQLNFRTITNFFSPENAVKVSQDANQTDGHLDGIESEKKPSPRYAEGVEVVFDKIKKTPFKKKDTEVKVKENKNVERYINNDNDLLYDLFNAD
jgi:hypothetical protein